MFRKLLCIVNPFDRCGGYAIPHVVIAMLLGAVLALAGDLTVRHYTATYFRQHYQAPIPVPKASKPQPITQVVTATSGSINLARYPAVGDQGPMGSCAAWATAWAGSYEYRVRNPKSWLRFSPRQMYSHYADTYAGGQDFGSWPDQDIEMANTTGLLQFKALPYPPYQIDNPELPTIDAWGHPSTVDAAKHRVPFTVHEAYVGTQGGGQAVVDWVEAAILANHPTITAIPVYPQFDSATETGGLITMPQPGDQSRGGHAIVAIAFDNSKVFPDGWVGGIEIQNQWGLAFGVQGRAWLETRFIAQYSFGEEYLTIGPGASAKHVKGVVPADGGKAPFVVHRAGSSHPITKSAGWYVRPFYTSDTHQNIAPLINAISTRNSIWPVYSLAVILTESAGNVYSERWAGGLDNSCGLMQQIVTNVESFTGLRDARSACNWEEIPANSIYYGTLLLHQYMEETGVTYPSLWQCYNAGPGSCQSPYYGAFLQNYYLALTYATSAPPSPPHFPAHKWGHRVSPYDHGRHLRWEALAWWNGHVKSAGKAISAPQWFPPMKGRSFGYMTMRFSNERYYWWPKRRGLQKWIRVRHIGAR